MTVNNNKTPNEVIKKKITDFGVNLGINLIKRTASNQTITGSNVNSSNIINNKPFQSVDSYIDNIVQTNQSNTTTFTDIHSLDNQTSNQNKQISITPTKQSSFQKEIKSNDRGEVSSSLYNRSNLTTIVDNGENQSNTSTIYNSNVTNTKIDTSTTTNNNANNTTGNSIDDVANYINNNEIDPHRSEISTLMSMDINSRNTSLESQIRNIKPNHSISQPQGR